MAMAVGGSLARCSAVWAAVTAGAAAVVGLALPEVARAGPVLTGPGSAARPFDQVLVSLCAVVALGTATWLWSVTTIVTIEALTGVRRRLPGVPDVLRRLVLSACGAAVAGGVAAALPTSALAAPGGPHVDPGRASGAAVVAGLPLPDRASTASQGRARQHRGPAPSTRRLTVVVVRPGDNLWALARSDLAPGADDARIAAAVREIHRLNRAVIGPDPDLIRAGQRLRLPDPTPPGPHERR